MGLDKVLYREQEEIATWVAAFSNFDEFNPVRCSSVLVKVSSVNSSIASRG